ncbi:MAG: hypothetical protein J5546_00755 [Lachnospiraceae bacterium]|nr:hypothetical protein [Lachnospiraceae bacterium]
MKDLEVARSGEDENMKDLEEARIEEERIAGVGGGTDMPDAALKIDLDSNEYIQMLEAGAKNLRFADSLSLGSESFASTGGASSRYETG